MRFVKNQQEASLFIRKKKDKSKDIQKKNQASRLIIESIISSKDFERIKEAKLLLKGMIGRGLKQRLKKKAKSVFG